MAYWALKFTRYGRLLTVVIFDRETAAAFGINVTLVYTVTFIIGAMLGALGGAVMAPKISVTLGIGVEVIVLAFAVVAIGGMGSIEGALIGALIVGICRAAAVHLVPQLELFVIYAVMALVLVFRPYGLFTRAAAAEDMTMRWRADLVGAAAFVAAAAVGAVRCRRGSSRSRPSLSPTRWSCSASSSCGAPASSRSGRRCSTRSAPTRWRCSAAIRRCATSSSWCWLGGICAGDRRVPASAFCWRATAKSSSPC